MPQYGLDEVATFTKCTDATMRTLYVFVDIYADVDERGGKIKIKGNIY